MAALVKEISISPSLDQKTEKEIISTIYFGGGTPSILTADDMKLIFDVL